MKKLNFCLLAIVLPVVVILLIGGIILYNLIDVNLNDLNGKGQVVSTIESPNNNYVAEIRLIDENGNATTPIQQAVSVSSNASNQNHLEEETVYWEIHSDSETPEVNWLDEDTINVNGKIIDVLDKDTYYNWQETK
ncbi:hypothetical protein GZ22_10465 [Terribacillus saccharophilus]|uniref:DUF5412 domain-containing protein n=1 Tax=Terribacillus saccharophilus TaxID=361277 RepID=A0A075LJV0_9BACI|nr:MULTISPECIES: DUF5412 family protein [Terribacillus]AIF67025.1 hypothetical protein GZ22_10465 [Terribacillus goriensis]MCM3224219.1 DUF5412 domain-containing protein [Terribacillus saccharophilus]